MQEAEELGRELLSSRQALDSLEGRVTAGREVVEALVAALQETANLPLEVRQALLSGQGAEGVAAARQLPGVVCFLLQYR